jgi:hypothetical protein
LAADCLGMKPSSLYFTKLKKNIVDNQKGVNECKGICNKKYLKGVTASFRSFDVF